MGWKERWITAYEKAIEEIVFEEDIDYEDAEKKLDNILKYDPSYIDRFAVEVWA